MNSNLLSVPEAARRIGVSEARVKQRIADGSLAAERVSGRWAIPASALRSATNVRHARPLSGRMAWAVLYYLGPGGDDSALADMVPAERHRARTYANRLRHDDDPASLMRAWFKHRAERSLFRVASDDLDDLRHDARARLAGVSLPDSGVVAPGVVELYASPEDAEELINEYFLVPAAGGDANVVIHIARARIDPASPAVIAADLAEHNGSREDNRVAELVGAG